MDKRIVRSVLMGCLVMGLVLGQTNATFQSCYESCFIICFLTPNNSIFSCSFKCLKDCIIEPCSLTQTSSNYAKNDKLYFCKLGCASSFCTNLSSKHNPRSEKVERCVDSCSETCTKN